MRKHTFINLERNLYKST